MNSTIPKISIYIILSAFFVVIQSLQSSHILLLLLFLPLLLQVMTFKTEEEALRLANDTTFGLGAGILSRDTARCERFARAFRAGIVWVNCSQPCFVQCPWGGMKKSGVGRELGKWGLENYLEVKQVTSYQVKEPGQWKWFIKSSL